MSQLDQLVNAFAQGLQIEKGRIVNDLKYGDVPEWDSIAHMAVIAEIEQTFGIMLDTDDIVAMESFAKAKEILAKYNVSV
jgi:acyl carrier protein